MSNETVGDTIPEIDGGFGVTLRQLTVADAQRYFDLVDYDRKHFRDAHQNTADDYRTVEDVIESITDPDPEKLGRVRFGIWADGVMVGSINYEPLDEEGVESVEIGYWIGKEFIRRGYAANAVRTLLPYIFGRGFRTVEAWAHSDNEASRQTLRTTGFTEQADTDTHDDGVELVRYAFENPHTVSSQSS